MKIIQGKLTNAKFVESPYYNERPIGELITLLVIHNISLPPNVYGGDYVEKLFTGKLDPSSHQYFAQIAHLQVSSHLFIKRTGDIIQFVPFEKRAWHAGVSSFNGKPNCNDYSIGIELEGCDTDPFTAEQYKKLISCCKCLKKNYPIEHITGHQDIAPERKTDPGPYFDWDYLNSHV